MSLVKFAVSLGFLAIFFTLQSSNAQPLNADIESRIESVRDKVVTWRRDIHQHPELGNREFRTSEMVAEHLESLGIEVQRGVAHTGVVGVLRGGKPGPVVALRADMDALPVTERVDIPYASKQVAEFNGQQVGVMHACGHDTHVAMLMGTAEVLAGMRDQLAGTVKFIFQPAEEGPPEGEEGGAKLMVEQGVMKNPDVDVVFGFHINSALEVNHISYVPGGAMASADDFRIVIKGAQTHGAYPWNGSDPIVAAAQMITALQTIVSRRVRLTENPAVVTIGMIRGGVRSNIIPEQLEMMGTMRALHPQDRLDIIDHMHSIVSNTAAAMGVEATLTLPVTTSYPVTFNNLELTETMLPVIKAVAGEDKVMQYKPVMGAEDFSYYAQEVPGLFLSLGGRPSDVAPEDAAPHHTPDFYVSDSGLQLGVRTFVALTMDYMSRNPK